MKKNGISVSRGNQRHSRAVVCLCRTAILFCSCLAVAVCSLTTPARAASIDLVSTDYRLYLDPFGPPVLTSDAESISVEHGTQTGYAFMSVGPYFLTYTTAKAFGSEDPVYVEGTADWRFRVNGSRLFFDVLPITIRFPGDNVWVGNRMEVYLRDLTANQTLLFGDIFDASGQIEYPGGQHFEIPTHPDHLYQLSYLGLSDNWDWGQVDFGFEAVLTPAPEFGSTGSLLALAGAFLLFWRKVGVFNRCNSAR